jgi:23S rRNA (adenine1618-N6)-methyltransferase
LKKAGAVESHTIEMGQGQKQSRFVAWTFQDKARQASWRAERWAPSR